LLFGIPTVASALPLHHLACCAPSKSRARLRARDRPAWDRHVPIHRMALRFRMTPASSTPAAGIRSPPVVRRARRGMLTRNRFDRMAEFFAA